MSAGIRNIPFGGRFPLKCLILPQVQMKCRSVCIPHMVLHSLCCTSIHLGFDGLHICHFAEAGWETKSFFLCVFCQAWVGRHFARDPAASCQVHLPPRVSLFFSFFLIPSVLFYPSKTPVTFWQGGTSFSLCGVSSSFFKANSHVRMQKQLQIVYNISVIK